MVAQLITNRQCSLGFAASWCRVESDYHVCPNTIRARQNHSTRTGRFHKTSCGVDRLHGESSTTRSLRSGPGSTISGFFAPLYFIITGPDATIALRRAALTFLPLPVSAGVRSFFCCFGTGPLYWLLSRQPPSIRPFHEFASSLSSMRAPRAAVANFE